MGAAPRAEEDPVARGLAPWGLARQGKLAGRRGVWSSIMRARALFATLLLFAACGPAASPEAPTPTPVGDPHASGAEAPPGESGREPARAEAAIPPMPELPTAVGFLRFPALPERAEIAAARQRVATIVAREPAWYPTGGTEETSRWSREALAPCRRRRTCCVSGRRSSCRACLRR